MRQVLDKAGLSGSVEVSSAGTIGMHAGKLPDSRMRSAAARRGYQLQSRARQIRQDDLADFDLILPMDDSNLQAVLRLARDDSELVRVRSFCGFCTRYSETQVPDPYYGGPEGFDHVIDLLEDGCEGLLKHLQATFSAAPQ